MYNTVLVPLDGSIRAEAILPHVEFITEFYRAKTVFLRIEEPALMLGRDEIADLSKCREEFSSRKKEAEVYLEEKKREFLDKGFDVETRISFGPVVKTILTIAEDIQADLIAIASHGLGGSQRMFYGSVAAGILQRIDRPLLIIRTRRI